MSKTSTESSESLSSTEPSESLPSNEPVESSPSVSPAFPSPMTPLPQKTPNPPPRETGKRIRHLFWSTLRLGVSAGLIAAGAIYLLREQQTITSQKGFINGSLSMVKAPLTGQLQINDLQAGDRVQAGQLMGTVENPRNPQLELQRQTMETRIERAKTQLATIRQKQQTRLARLAQIRQTQTVKKQVVFQYDSQRIDQVQSDIRRDKQTITAALREHKRLAELADVGAISRRDADQARDRYQDSKLALEATQQRLKQAQAEQIASQQGIKLQDGGETEQAELLAQAIATEISDLELDEADLLTQIYQTQQEREHLLLQLSLQQQAAVKAPVSGIVWATERTAGGSPVTANEPLLHLLDCSNTWVESFVSERDLASLEVGTPVTVRWLGQREQTAQGRVRSVRAGVGRLAIGEGVAVPPPEQSRREVGVQIDWVNMSQDLAPKMTQSRSANSSKTQNTVASSPPVSTAQFCGVGQSVEVTFELESNDQPSVALWQDPLQWLSQRNWPRFSQQRSNPPLDSQAKAIH